MFLTRTTTIFNEDKIFRQYEGRCPVSYLRPYTKSNSNANKAILQRPDFSEQYRREEESNNEQIKVILMKNDM